MAVSEGVAQWYSGKNIFISGGSGFVGICLIEKLLRCVPNGGDIYLMLRPKRGKEIGKRLDELKTNPIFERVLEGKSVEQVFARVKAVAGDIGSPGLGLSPADRQILTDNVNVIFHSAATLDFADSLKTTININLLGTRKMLELASQCRNLKAFVHVSSAYVNSYLTDLSEILYPLKEDPEKIINLINTKTDAELEEMTPALLGDHPNAYTFTKQMAEHEVQKMQAKFPCTIVRPSMIIGAWKEPVPGWTNSKNGPQGFLMGAAKGIIRRLPMGKHLIYDYIPVDLVVNHLIVAGCHAGVTQTKTVEIYHSTTSTRQPFRWASVENEINGYLHRFPLKSAVWYPYLKFLPSITWFRISAFFVHIIPAFLLDTVTRISGGRPILMKLHRNVNTSLGRLEKFIFTEWTFKAENTEKLHSWLKPDEQNTFGVSVTGLEWQPFFVDLSKGVRRYLNNEKMSNIEAARGKDTMLLLLHVLLQAGILGLIWYLFACTCGISMTNATFVVPASYIMLSYL